MSRSLVLSLLAAGLLSACVVAPYGHRGGVYAAPAPVVVAPGPPPAPMVEVVPALPYPGAIWIGGYWGWGGGRHAWVPGRWERPRHGYHWQPHRWEPVGGQWRLHGGEWRQRR